LDDSKINYKGNFQGDQGLKTLFNTPIKPQCSVSVVIPVRDEAQHLAATLDAFAVQVDLQNRPLNADVYEILIFSNNCRDA